MLATYVLAAAILSATYAAAIEQYRQTSSKPNFYVRIPGKNLFNFHKGQTLKVRCKAKGGHDIDDIPMISFYVSSFFSWGAWSKINMAGTHGNVASPLQIHLWL